MWAQVLGRGLTPRLSIGTLQLSIRCSSIHFLPSRSFPVRAVGVFTGTGAALGVAGSSRVRSWADAATGRQIASHDTSKFRCKNLINGLVSFSVLRCEQEEAQ